MSDYQAFLRSKRHSAAMAGFKLRQMPAFLYDFQASLVDWALAIGRGAIFADCGLGKTPIQLVWAQSVVESTNRPVLIVAPLAVSSQTVREAIKFGIPAVRSQDGTLSGRAEIVVTNYERLHHFRAQDVAGVVCDESSILKNFDGVTKAAITEFMRSLSYRLLCTATAAPNDYIELGTSSEALGQLGYMDMLSMFFKNDEGSIAPLSYASKWRFKPHAERPFWRWLCSWARALRHPSDLGFSDTRFVLPALTERVSIVEASRPADGRLFVVPAKNLHEQRWERRATLRERCERAAAISQSHTRPYLAWCHLNDEGDTLADLMPDAVQVSGSDEDDEKIEKFDAFALGQVRGLITKPKIGSFGLNWQHCADMTTFPSHSYEQYYQGVRRCWRYGQTRDVTVDIISTEGEADVMGSLKRKAAAADLMFAEMVAAMHDAMGVTPTRQESIAGVPLPAWLQADVPVTSELTDQYALYLGDCCEVITGIPDESVHLSVYSPPFCGLYNYSSSDRDMSNCRSRAEFFEHYTFLVEELGRVMMPGRITAVHCADIPNGGGTLYDFPGDIVKLHEAHGLRFIARHAVWKEPFGVRMRTMAKGLAHRQVVEDAALCDVASADYLLLFRKDGENPIPIAHPSGLMHYAGERQIPTELLQYRGWEGAQTGNRFSHWIWRQYASAFWDDVRIDRVVPYEASKDPDDEKHVHPLQLDVIERVVILRSNPGETVLTPFMGVGSEVYGAVINGRKGIGVELKPSYYKQAVKNAASALTERDREQAPLFADMAASAKPRKDSRAGWDAAADTGGL